MGRWRDFRQCPHCGLDLATGDGEPGCAWGDCAYLPAELDVWCPQCRYNFNTGEGNPPCSDPETCEHAEEVRGNVVQLREWLAERSPVR